MTEPAPRYLLTFANEAELTAALDRLADAGVSVLDLYMPYGNGELAERLGLGGNRLGRVALIGGLAGAAGIFLLQCYAFLVAYPFDSGGRSGFAWPAFLIPTFEVGVLCAVIATAIAMLRANGLPRLHHPLFELPGFERVTQDEIALLVQCPDGPHPGWRDALLGFGAHAVREVWE